MTLTSNYLRNLIRTFFPAVAGAVIAYVTHLTAHLTPSEQAFVFGGGTTVYYGLFRFLEMKFKWASVFLGAVPIKYQPPVTVQVAPPAPTA